jgi:hypothetical protein
MSIRLSAPRTWIFFYQILYWRILIKPVEKIHTSVYDQTKITGTFHKDRRIFTNTTATNVSMVELFSFYQD